jgi:7-cyano-7-deazaguanine synthase in queuosine biosynthesis
MILNSPDINPRMPIALSFSCGLDSTTVLAMLTACGVKPHLIVIDNGILGAKVRVAAKELAEYYDVPYQIYSAKFIQELQFPAPNLYTPGFRLLMTQLALAGCEKVGAHVLYTGCEVADDEDLPRWTDVLSKTGTGGRAIHEESATAWRRYAQLYQDTYGWEVSIIHPFYFTKSNILQLGLKLGVPAELTFSCFTNFDRRADDGRWIHCGRCRGCIGRFSSYAKVAVPDPTIYDVDPRDYIQHGGNYRIETK